MSNTLTIFSNPTTILVTNTTPANKTALASTEAETWQLSEKKGLFQGAGSRYPVQVLGQKCLARLIFRL
ncbi:hypothetical protein PSMA108079_19700 [Pseudoalteromonas mariniglutinosa]